MPSRNYYAGPKSLGLVICLAFAGLRAGAQSTGTLDGTVLDGATRQPVPFATVFLANTLIGNNAAADGTFRLEHVPFGKYELTVSSVGYRLSTQSIEISVAAKNQIVLLNPDVKVLKSVEVKSSNSDYLRNLRKFKKYFLGETSNAEKCTILNLDDIELSYNHEDKVLTATCDKPIVVENKALGYRVYYLMIEFKLDEARHYFSLAGIPRFELMTSERESDNRRWKKERDRAYHGSIRHFMRSLKFTRLEKEGFRMYLLTRERPASGGSVETVNDSSWFSRRIRESELFKHDYNEHLFLMIVYSNENQEINYNRTRGANLSAQKSYLKFSKHGLVIYDNGSYDDELSYYSSGYFGWNIGIAELVPLEYLPDDEPSERVQKKE